MSRFIFFCAAIVNSQVWAAALMFSKDANVAGACAALSVVWIVVAGCFLPAPQTKEPKA